MDLKRVFAGFYTRYDGKPIFVVRVLRDIDTGEAIVVCKDVSFSREDNEHYYLIRYASFCEKVEVDGELRDKYVRQTRREIDTSIVREVYEDGFPEPKSKRFTYVDDEYEDRFIRCSKTYYEYAKDICENYRMDMQRYRLIRERSAPSVAAEPTMNTPTSSGNAFPRGCPSAKQRMPCSRIAAWSSGGRPRSIGRSPSFCSSGMRQMVSVG